MSTKQSCATAPQRSIAACNRAHGATGARMADARMPDARMPGAGMPRARKSAPASRTHNALRGVLPLAAALHWQLAALRVKYRAFQAA
ncbi:hypothetical protein [Paraburkholderia atlantica]|uniref:hypothetical protein n=1 Tax=Paraburkholderia atlantica TaxID=2654982 RepID=UPI0012FE9563|nr:hypothetical protein [Paraburkholderia atlantica]